MIYSAVMVRHMLIYGTALAALALLAEALELGHGLHALPTSLFILGVALLFAGLGGWLGTRLVPRARSVPFARNVKALAALGISARECEVLDLLAQGHANKVIARRLAISPNTVKTHIARLFEKLEASSRTQAIHKARALELIS